MAGLLGDVLPWAFSQGNRLKRQVGGLLADPIGSARQNLGLLDDKAREHNAMEAMAFGDKKNPGRITDPKAFDAHVNNVFSSALGFAPAGMTAWHGSPHKFDKFDSSKIGSGEGAQAYGHGLYLAESPEVAKEYQKRLTDDAFKYKGMNEAKARIQEKLAARFDIADPAKAAQIRSQISTLEPGGALYKVDLPDNAVARMLDWDKPLSQQAENVRKFFEPHVAPIRAEMAKPADPGWGALAAPSHFDPSGQELMALLRNRDAPMTAQSFFGNGLGPAVSSKLREQGVPGIRYVDGGSRTAGGTSNFVVFPGEENILKILERNGQPVR